MTEGEVDCDPGTIWSEDILPAKLKDMPGTTRSRIRGRTRPRVLFPLEILTQPQMQQNKTGLIKWSNLEKCALVTFV